MKRSIFAALLVLSVCNFAAAAQSASASDGSKPDISSLAAPEHPATEAQVREFLALTHAIDLAHQVMQQDIHTSRITSAPYFTGGFWDDMETALMQIDLVPYFIPAYQKYFSEEDMASLIAFYKTPAGQRLLAAQPLVSAAAKDSLATAGREAGRKVAEKHAEEIERLIKQQQQPQRQPSIDVPNVSK